ncbi:MAG: hypothetical protein SFY68_11825, partial [Candidatus Sumerlaeia bacterium]|nr:hypothetical protein [Candidatus Sumerlaeia bacterium]
MNLWATQLYAKLVPPSGSLGCGEKFIPSAARFLFMPLQKHLLLTALLLLGVTPWVQGQTLTVAPAPEAERTVNLKIAEAVEYNDTRVMEIPDLESGPKDFWVLGTIGDIRLQNDLALMQFGKFKDTNDPKEQIRNGGLLDLTVGENTPENFHVFSPNTVSGMVFALKITGLDYKKNSDGSASVFVRGLDVRYPFLTVESEYRMPKDMPGVLLTTTYTNTSADQTAEKVIPSDYIRWGAMIPFIPGEGVLRNGQEYPNLEFVFAKQYDIWMLIAPETGSFKISHSGVEHSGLEYAPIANIAPGETQVIRRWILVGKEDPGYLFSKVLEKRPNQDVGTLVGRLIEKEQLPDGTVVESGPVPNAEVRITPRIRPDMTEEVRQQFSGKPYLIYMTDANGVFNGILPVGEYQIFPAPTARISPESQVLTRIKKNEITAVDYGASKPARLIYQILNEKGERIPGKISIEPLRNTPPVELGPPGELRSGNSIISLRGAGFVELNPGNYRVVAS